jgi:hypothetical protein
VRHWILGLPEAQLKTDQVSFFDDMNYLKSLAEAEMEILDENAQF